MLFLKTFIKILSTANNPAGHWSGLHAFSATVDAAFFEEQKGWEKYR